MSRNGTATTDERIERRRRIWCGVLAFAIPLVLYAVTLNGTVSTDYTSSILGTQFALWRDRTFSLGPQGALITETLDKGLHEGQFYSAISPGIGMLTFPLAAIGFRMEGGEFNVFGNALLLDEAVIALAGAWGALFAYRIASFYAAPVPSMFVALSLALGTTVWPFATVLFPHTVSMFFSIVAVFLVLRYIREPPIGTWLLLAGWSLGLAAFVEYVAGLMALPLLWFLLHRRVRASHVLLFVTGVVVGPFLHLAFNLAAFGDPFVFPESLKAHEESGLLGRFDLVGFPGHLLAYLVSPYRGVLLVSPVLGFGVYGLWRMFRKSALRSEAILFVALFLVVAMSYSMWWDWAGGVGYGPRFMIMGLPFLAIPIAVALSERRFWFIALFGLCFAWSGLAQAAGALDGPFSVGDVWTYEPASAIRGAFDGSVVAWWLLRVPASDPLVSRILAVGASAVVLALAAVAVMLLRRTGTPARTT